MGFIKILLSYKTYILGGLLLSTLYFGGRRAYLEYKYRKSIDINTERIIDCLKKNEIKDIEECLD